MTNGGPVQVEPPVEEAPKPKESLLGKAWAGARKRGSAALSKLKPSKVGEYQHFIEALGEYLKTAREWRPTRESRTAILGAVGETRAPEEVIKAAKAQGKAIGAIEEGLFRKLENLKPLAAYTREEKLWLLKALFRHMETEITGTGRLTMGPVANTAIELFDDMVQYATRTGGEAGTTSLYNILAGLRVTGTISEPMMSRFAGILGQFSAAEFRSIIASNIANQAEATQAADDFVRQLLDPKRQASIANLIEDLERKHATDEVARIAQRVQRRLLARPESANELQQLIRPLADRHPTAYAALKDKVDDLFALSRSLAGKTGENFQAALREYTAAVNAEFGEGFMQALRVPENIRKMTTALRRLIERRPTLGGLIDYARRFEVDLEPLLQDIKKVGKLPYKERMRAYLRTDAPKQFGKWFAIMFVAPISATVAGVRGLARAAVKHPGRTGGVVGLVAFGTAAYLYLSREKPKETKPAAPTRVTPKLRAKNERRRAEEKARIEALQKVRSRLQKASIIPGEITTDNRTFLETNPKAWAYLDQQFRAADITDVARMDAEIEALRINPEALQAIEVGIDLGKLAKKVKPPKGGTVDIQLPEETRVNARDYLKQYAQAHGLVKAKPAPKPATTPKATPKKKKKKRTGKKKPGMR